MTEQHNEAAYSFAGYLARLAEPNNPDRAALAALRRGLGKRPGEAPEMFPYVVPRLPRDAHGWVEETYYLVASLFAIHQQSWQGGGPSTDLGASMSRLQRTTDNESTTARFVALLNSRRDDVGAHLQSIIGLLATHDIPVDWAKLLRDLQRWNNDNRVVQRRWARSFWGSPEQDDTSPTSTPQSQETTTS